MDYGIVPDSPRNLTSNNVQNTSVVLQWDIPWIFNGKLKSFILHADELQSVNNVSCCISIKPVEVVIYDEKPSYNYTVKIFSCIYIYLIYPIILPDQTRIFIFRLSIYLKSNLTLRVFLFLRK